MQVFDLFLDTTQPPAITDACLKAIGLGHAKRRVRSVWYFDNSIRIALSSDMTLEIQGDATFWKESPCPPT